MEREELLELVNTELGATQLTLSERTINEELDDSLAEFGDDEAVNKGLVTKIANRLKRMDGNLHSDVSKQVEDYKKNYKPTPKPSPKPSGDESEALKEMRAELAALKAESEARKKGEKRETILKEVRKGLEEKFDKAGIKVNNFFMRGALNTIEIPEEGAEIDTLIAKAEKAYNADMKEAGIEPDQKPYHGGGGGKGSNAATDFFARKAKKEGWQTK